MRPRAGATQQADRDQAAVAVLEGHVIDVAEHLLLLPEQLVVEQPQAEGEWGARFEGRCGSRGGGHWPAPVSSMRGMAATEATTTTTR